MKHAVCWSLLGSSPHPSMTEEEDSQSELLIAEEKMSPEQEGQLMPRYSASSSPNAAVWQICLCSPTPTVLQQGASSPSALAVLWHLLESVEHQINLVPGEKSRCCLFIMNTTNKNTDL